MLIATLPFCISVVYSMYDKFAISEVVQMSLCRLLAYVLVLEKRGLIKLFMFLYMLNGSCYSLSGSTWTYSITMHLTWITLAR